MATPLRPKGTPGPKPKGVRKQLTVKVPADHASVYELRAREAGVPLMDYIAAVLAEAHALPEPEYLRKNRAQGVLDVAS